MRDRGGTGRLPRRPWGDAIESQERGAEDRRRLEDNHPGPGCRAGDALPNGSGKEVPRAARNAAEQDDGNRHRRPSRSRRIAAIAKAAHSSASAPMQLERNRVPAPCRVDRDL